MAMLDANHPPQQEVADAQDEIRQLRRALRTRPVIDQAKGMLMAQHGCTADEAFAMLSQASQRANRKLSNIAQDMITGAAGSRAAADRRDIAADARDMAADDRDRLADRRDTQAQLRDAVAAEQEAFVSAIIVEALRRDQGAERRDRLAEARDCAAENRPAGTLEDLVAAGRDRGDAARDRARAGEDRDLSAGDRADLRETWKRALATRDTAHHLRAEAAADCGADCS